MRNNSKTYKYKGVDMNNLEDIKDLLDRAEKYRKEHFNHKSNHQTENTDFFDMYDIVKDFYINPNGSFEIIYSSNIFETITITEQEAINGCTKQITYEKKNKFLKDIKSTIDINIPKGIKNRENLIIKGKGNCINKKGECSDLIIKIIIK